MAAELTPQQVMDAVEEHMGGLWVWGKCDCTIAAANVFQALHGIDPMASVRNSYSDAMGAARLIKSWGGMMAMGSALARISGLTSCGAVTGAIGISAVGVASGLEGRSALICIEPGLWAGKTENGFAVIDSADRCWTNV